MAASSNSDPKNPEDQEHDPAGQDAAPEDGIDAAPETGQGEPLLLKPLGDADEESAVGEDGGDLISEDAEPGEDAEDNAAIEDAELVSNGEEEPRPGDEPVTEAAQEPEPEPRPEPVRSEPVQGGSGGFLPLLLGGVAAAGIGFAVARYAVPEGWPTPAAPDAAVDSALSAQADRIAVLEAAIADMPDAPTMPVIDEAAITSAVESELGEALRSERTAALDALSERVDTLAAEIAALADRPVADGNPSLSDEQIAALQSNLDAAVADARAEMEAALEAAAAAEAAADRAAQAASARAALDRVRAAAEAGTPYGDELDPIRAAGTEIPEALAGAADAGVPALAVLQESFPDAARAALDASIRAGGSDAPMDRALAFLRTQTGARSLTPREGGDPDAVLSRAEAALRSGDLAAVLAELDTLPEAGQAEMSTWRAEAETRAAVLSALAELAQALDET